MYLKKSKVLWGELMKKSLKGSVIILLIIILSSVTAFIFIKNNEPYTKIINMNWSIKLPSSYKEIYSIDSGASFQGDGQRYHILKYDGEDDLNLALNWENNKNEYMETSVQKVLNTLNVSKGNMPDFQDNYKYYTKILKDNSKIYLIFFTDTKKLYVIEDIY